MTFGFTDWDGANGTIKPGSIKRASSSNDKVWGEENLTETKLPYGTFGRRRDASRSWQTHSRDCGA